MVAHGLEALPPPLAGLWGQKRHVQGGEVGLAPFPLWGFWETQPFPTNP